ncbi:O-Antigen ligase [Haladaptatus litoreus]|uniref:O-Antigen ligase n=1 Tax=Haladaptatus litoreus TaxID=553468 RepID=A0A1N7DCG2_9EURY|nr:O-antigen ligase family protein [Haladaptatus litoreus]SIR73447.1 O-Antigen ligase [Haladaptatus litoreus]
MSLQDQQKTSTSLSLNPFAGQFHPIALIQILLIPLLFVDLLIRSTNSPEQYGSFHLALLYLYFAPLLLLMRSYYDDNRDLWLHVAQISVLILLTFILFRQRNKYIPVPDEGRFVHVTLIFLLYALYPFISHDFLQFLRSRAVYIGSYVTLLGVYFYHVNEMSAGSTRASFVVYVALIFGLNLFFIPRYVSRNIFLLGVSIMSAFTVLIGLPAYVIGNYELSWLQIQLFNARFQLPLIGTEVQFLQSILSNPNILGALAFSGAFGALVIAVESAQRRQFLPIPIAATLLLVNGLGMYLTYARASWLAFCLASTVYLGYIVIGRKSVPYIVISLGILTLLFFMGMFLSVIPINTHGRFALWTGGLRAFLDAPSPLGYGMINTHEAIAPYVPDPNFRGFSPHNSYVQIFLNTGIVGGLAYIMIVLGSIFEGIVRKNTVDVPMLGFALAFAVHQMFAVYTLFNTAVASILSALVFGYLICGYRK